MLKIGVTGGIATGKSTVSNILIGLGIPVISCDKLVRSFQEPGNVLWSSIKELWGDKYIGTEYSLNRKLIAEDLVNDEFFRVELEKITHSLIKQEIEKIFDVWDSEGEKLAGAEVPLLFEAKWEKMFDKFIVTTVEESVQIERIKKKKSDMEKVLLKMKDLQYSQAEKIKKADLVIYSEENEEIIGQQLKNFLEGLKV